MKQDCGGLAAQTYGTEPLRVWKTIVKYINPTLTKEHAETGSLYQWMLNITRGLRETDVFIGQGKERERGKLLVKNKN